MQVLGYICYAAMAFILVYQCVKLVQEIILKCKLKKMAKEAQAKIENDLDGKN